MYFQDLPLEFKEKIIKRLKHDLRGEAVLEGYICNDEYIDDYINRRNTIDNVKYWVNNYCL